jgi:hypothetical protein
MGRQARDRPPKGVIDRLHWDIALGAAIAPPLLLLGLGLLPRLSPTAPAIAQSCQESMGQAITGAPVQLDACSFIEYVARVCNSGSITLCRAPARYPNCLDNGVHFN